VVAYALTLHTTPGRARPRRIPRASRCAECGSTFADMTRMAALSESDLVRMIRDGRKTPPVRQDTPTPMLRGRWPI